MSSDLKLKVSIARVTTSRFSKRRFGRRAKAARVDAISGLGTSYTFAKTYTTSHRTSFGIRSLRLPSMRVVARSDSSEWS